jgi:hypothetical protein
MVIPHTRENGLNISDTRTRCSIVLGRAVEIDIRRWHADLYTLSAVRTSGVTSGTDFEHYGSFSAAHHRGLRVARAILRAL